MELVQNSFAELEINYTNCMYNYNYFRSKLKSSTKLLILVKANSYGHGAVEFASVMEEAGADYFGVAHPIEGIELREGGIKTPIITLTSGTEQYRELVKYNLEPSIPSLHALKVFNNGLEEMGVDEYPVHIALDTGMHRLGFMENELPALLDFLKNNRRIKVQSVYSHLAASDEPQHDEFTLGQIELYQKMASRIDAVLGYKPMHHILNTAGIERFIQYQFDMVRLGIGIYGISTTEQSQLKPLASLTCKIIQTKELQPDDGTIGYGRHGKLHKDKTTVTATLPLGYADGISRNLGKGNVRFCVNGQLVPTIGNICMDMCMIDITGVDAKVGDKVTIFGDNPSIKEIAMAMDTIPYEVITSVARRVKRVVVGR